MPCAIFVVVTTTIRANRRQFFRRRKITMDKFPKVNNVSLLHSELIINIS